MAREIIDVMIEDMSEIVEYYPDGNLNWAEIASNFALSNKFIEDNILNFDEFDKANNLIDSEESSKTLLLMNQSLSTSFLLKNIKYFDLDLAIIYQEIKDANLIDELKEIKKMSIETESNVEIIEELVVEESTTIEETPIIIPTKEVITIIEEPKIIEPIKTLDVEVRKTFIKPIIAKKPFIDVEQLSIDRLRELDVDFNSIVGMHLSKIYVNKFNELKSKYDASISQFENLILTELSAKA